MAIIANYRYIHISHLSITSFDVRDSGSTMNVSLTRELQSYVGEQLRKGTYASQSEVIRAGLRLLIERDQLFEATKQMGAAAATAAARTGDPGAVPGLNPTPEALPRSLWHYFPEHDARRLSPTGDRDTILGRLLDTGGIDAIRWLRAAVPAQELRDFIRRRRGRGLGPKNLRFWALILGLPAEEVDPWVRDAASGPWANRVG